MNKAIIPQEVPKQEFYTRKTQNNLGPFQSQDLNRGKDYMVQASSKLFDGTTVRASTSNKKFKSFKSTYKNASSITFDHASAGQGKSQNTLVRPQRNWQKDRDIYGSDIMNASTMPDQPRRASKARIFSPQHQRRNDLLSDGGSEMDILSERDTGDN